MNTERHPHAHHVTRLIAFFNRHSLSLVLDTHEAMRRKSNERKRESESERVKERERERDDANNTALARFFTLPF